MGLFKSMVNESKKILVVGAGIAGPVVCYWLKRFGFFPTLIEKSSVLRKNGTGLDIRGSALEIAKRMNIYEQLYEQRTRVNRESYVDANGKVLVEKQAGYQSDDDLEIARCNLVEILMNSIEGVPCYFDEEVVGIKQHKENIEVSFKNNNTEFYDVVIGADGLRSSIRTQVFPADHINLVDLGAYISVFYIPNYFKINQSKILFESYQKVISVTVDGTSESAMVALMFRSHDTFNNSRNQQDQKNFIRNHFLDLGWETNKILSFLDSCDDFYFDNAAQIRMESWTKKRVALVGDAAYSPSPLSGQGTSLAFVGAYVLAGELKNAKGDYASAFDRYNLLLAPFVKANQELGMLVNGTFLLSENLSKEEIDDRTNRILENLTIARYNVNMMDYNSS